MSRGLSLLAVTMILFGLAPTSARAERPDYDVVFRAMNDELDRSMSELVMEDLERPYYLSYTVDDFQSLRIRSVLGTVVSSQLDRDRYLTVDLRVGDSTLDNSNFAAGFFSLRPSFRKVALRDDYDALRNEIYLETDEAYKQALKLLSRKRAALQNRQNEERPDDFLPPVPNRWRDTEETFDLEPQRYQDLARAGSVVLRDYPSIIASWIELEALAANQCFTSSRGAEVLRGDRTFTVTLTLYGKSAEGEDVYDSDQMVVRRSDQLPDPATMTAWVEARADAMVARLAAETIEEYAGPVIFEGDAAGAMLRQLFARNITGCPSPTYENDNGGRRGAGREFENRIRRRVLPEFMSAYDDPTIDRLGDLDLAGQLEMDDAGQVPERIQLVEDGRLTTLPIATAPTKKVKATNGHARGGLSKLVDAKPTNIVFQSNASISEDELRREMLELCKDFDLEYGIVIRELDDLYARRGRARVVFAGSGGDGDLTSPLTAFKVYPDGREEPLRNLEFSNVTTRLLRDIVRTADRLHAYSYLIGDDLEMPASIVSPSLLIEEVELTKATQTIEKPPVLPSPLADR